MDEVERRGGQSRRLEQAGFVQRLDRGLQLPVRGAQGPIGRPLGFGAD
jgi:hypothetical protein